jgi:hypothetical protein
LKPLPQDRFVSRHEYKLSPIICYATELPGNKQGAMSHLEMLSFLGTGHLYPLAALGRELARRGHQIKNFGDGTANQVMLAKVARKSMATWKNWRSDYDHIHTFATCALLFFLGGIIFVIGQTANGGKQNGLSKTGPTCIRQLARLAVREPCLKWMRGAGILKPPHRKHGYQFPCGGRLA